MTIYRRIFAYFHPESWKILLLIAFIFCGVGLDLLLKVPLAIFADLMTGKPPQSSWVYHWFLVVLPRNPAGQIIGLALLWLGLKLVLRTVWMLRMMLRNHIRYQGTIRVRKQLYNHFLQLSPAYHQATPQGDAIYRINQDPWGFFEVLDIFIGAVAAVGSFVAVLITLWSIHRKMTLFALASTPFLLLMYAYFGQRIKRRAIHGKQQESNYISLLQQSFSSLSLIQIFGRRSHENNRFDQANQNIQRANMRLHWQEELYPWLADILFASATALLLGYGGLQVYRHLSHPHENTGLSLGFFLIFLSNLPSLFDPLTWILGFPTRAKTNAVSCERVFTVLNEPLPLSMAPSYDEPLPMQPKKISLEHVSFRYQPDVPVLQDIHCEIPTGRLVALMGGSGTGKSSLMRLLLRLYDPIEGCLRLDGRDFRSIPLSDLRKYIAFVPQDAGLMPISIAENISYGRPEATCEDIHRAAFLAGISDFIEKLPGKYETILAEGSQNLSGGQRQRIAIARALLTEAPILIFDEPTSALDPKNAQAILRTLKQLRGSRTIILSTHQVEITHACDQVLELTEEGRLVTTQSPKQVSKNKRLGAV